MIDVGVTRRKNIKRQLNRPTIVFSGPYALPLSGTFFLFTRNEKKNHVLGSSLVYETIKVNNKVGVGVESVFP